MSDPINGFPIGSSRGGPLRYRPDGSDLRFTLLVIGLVVVALFLVMRS